jgi:hypothetical protein
MFKVLDHANVVFAGSLSQTTQYVIEHYGCRIDDAIRAGISISPSFPADQEPTTRSMRRYGDPIEDWEVD